MDKRIKTGSHVHYVSPHGAKENGILKSFNDEKTAAFVVFNCNGEWDKYYDYTGQLTNMQDLVFGWVDENGKLISKYCDHYYTATNSKWQSETQRSCQFCGDTID